MDQNGKFPWLRKSTFCFFIFLVLLISCSPIPKVDVSTTTPLALINTPTALPSPTPTSAPSPTVFASPTLEPESTFIQGVTLNFSGQNFNTDETRAVIKRFIIPSGANYVALIPTCWSKDWRDTSIICLNESDPQLGPPVRDDQLIPIIQFLHSQGLRVILKPQALFMSEVIEHQYGPARGQNWTEKEWQTWFDNYITFIAHYAEISEEYKVDLFVIGNEQQDTTQREADWRRVISAVRATYHGPITYAANAWQFEASRIKFWDALDYIGTNGYFGYVQNNNPTLADLKSAWGPIVKRLEEMSGLYKKPVLITEIGSPAQEKILTGTLYWWSCGLYNGQEQELYYKAFFEVLANKPWLKGIVLWDIDNGLMQGGSGDTAATFIGKPAEQVVHQFFGGPTLTPTPIFGFTEDLTNSAVIFDDALENGWTQWFDANALEHVDLQSTQAHQGKYAIRLPLSKISEVQLSHDPHSVDITQYKWIEFYVRVGKNLPQPLQVVFADWTPENYAWSRFVDVNNTAYMEGGQYQPGTWQRVRIPLIDLGITDKNYAELHIMGTFNNNCNADRADDVYIDDIRLVAGK